MNCIDIVRKYVDKFDDNVPIFVEDVRKYVTAEHKKNCGEAVRVALFRMAENNEIKRAYHGIYYKPSITIWGETALAADAIIKYKYLENTDGDITGYITGAKLYNAVGLTTQVPRMVDIATNVHKGKNKYVTDYNAVIRKPKLPIDRENYRYLQFFDLLKNEDGIQVEVNNPDDVMRTYFERSELEFTKMCAIAKNLRGGRMVIDKLIDLF